MSKKLVIFDFDGVLVNTIEPAFEIHKKANADFTWDVFRKMSEGNFHDGYKKALENGHSHPEDFFENYTGIVREASVPEAMHALIKSLRGGYILAVVSSSTSWLIQEKLNLEGVGDLFSDVLGSDVDPSKTRKIQKLLEKHSVQNTHAVMITDTLGDMREARVCDVSSIGVLWGLHDRDSFSKGEPFSIVEDVSELSDSIERFFAQA